VNGKFFVWDVLVKSFIRGRRGGRGRSLGNILGEDISNLLLLGKANWVEEEGVCLITHDNQPGSMI
jgi:hypothetical protein